MYRDLCLLSLVGVCLAFREGDSHTTGYGKEPNVKQYGTKVTDVIASKASNSNCKCGQPSSQRQGRIEKGVPVEISEYPWMVALYRNGFFGGRVVCGGSLINSRYVLTAAHCVDGSFPMPQQARIFEQDYKSDSEVNGTLIVGIEKYWIHPKYRKFDHDIALIRLSKEVPLGGYISPVCLPADNANSFANYDGTVAGWGSSEYRRSSVLRKKEVTIFSTQYCNSSETVYKGEITDDMVCAGQMDKDGNSGFGVYDSGDPLTIANVGRRMAVGIVNWTRLNGRNIGVYARIGVYINWILSIANTEDASWCTG